MCSRVGAFNEDAEGLALLAKGFTLLAEGVTLLAEGFTLLMDCIAEGFALLAEGLALLAEGFALLAEGFHCLGVPAGIGLPLAGEGGHDFLVPLLVLFPSFVAIPEHVPNA